MVLIQKQLNGDVFFLIGGTVVASLSEDVTFNLSFKRGGIDIIDEVGRRYFLEWGFVTQTQILPAAAVAFTGDLPTLWTLLVTYFFNELHATGGGGGGGGLETNIVSASGNYNILTTNYIIYAVGNGNFRLPTIGASIGQFYRIYANNNTVNVLCDDPAGDRITNLISITLKKYDQATFRAIATNLWLIGD